MKVAAAQINPTVGDIQGNLQKILTNLGRAKELGAQIILFPEMCLTGYPPYDLLTRSSFVDANIAALSELAPKVKGLTAVVGYVEKNVTAEGRPLYNAAAVIENGEIAYVTYKSLLPTYDLFDEDRYFEPAAGVTPLKIEGHKVALTLSEDLWCDEICGPRQPHHKDPVAEMAKKKIQLIFNIAASHWRVGTDRARTEMLKATAKKFGVPVVFCNQAGGNDELVFDGNSLAVDAKGEIIAHAKPFEEDLILIDLDYGAGDMRGANWSDTESLYRALVVGTRDYVHKSGFKQAILGLSGGLDSSLAAAIAAEALGPENVLGITMPSQFSSESAKADAEHLAKSLGIKFNTLPIQPLLDGFLNEYKRMFGGRPADATEENIQSRIRGDILMSYSNKVGFVVLSTANRSDISTGYVTLYGDAYQGFGVLADIPKSTVYKLAREVVNKDREVIPQSILSKAPSAELRAGQKDADALPEAEKLDAILELYIDQNRTIDEVAKAGHPKDVVEKVARLVDRAEYKRRQAPPGLKVTTKAFGMARRFPIARKF